MKKVSPHIEASVRIHSLSLFLLVCFFWLSLTETSSAQDTLPITSSGLNTTITQNGNIYDITGGTRPGNGPNLFHSFGEFGVPTNNIANFLNESGLPTSNILGRVTGGNISNVFGTIQTTGFDNANLFLMNPAGFLFGPNATVNVGGMVSFTSADYLKLADNARFNAVPNAAADALLTASPVAAFGFLGSNPGAITVQGTQFLVTQGTGISLVGGDIMVQAGALEDATIQPAKISAPGGEINLTSVASSGEVLALNYLPAPNTLLGSISLGPGTRVDVSGDAAGTVRIRSGEFVIDNATISADTVNSNGAPIAIDINSTGNVAISNDTAAALTARTAGAGDAGAIHIVSADLTATPPSADPSLAVIDTHTSGTGTAGNVALETDDLMVLGNPLGSSLFIHSGTAGSGNGGRVTVTARNAQFALTGINTGDSILFGTGSAGNIAITTESLTLDGVTFAADSLNAHGGNVALEGHNIHIAGGSFIDVLSLDGASTVSIKADQFVLDNLSNVINSTALGPGGGIAITARTVQVTNSSTVVSQTFGDGDAGSIRIVGTERVTLSDDFPSGFNEQPSGIFTNSFGDSTLGTQGKAGAIDITTPRLEITGGARINSTTQTSGRGGDVTIVASDSVTISGERASDVQSELFGLGSTRASGVYTRTVGSDFCSSVCGDAGNVTITTALVNVSKGAVIDTGTTTNGRGGDIIITASTQISLSGASSALGPTGVSSRTIGAASDAGSSGNITLTAGQSVMISNDSAVSASSTGPGDTGNIQIDAGNLFSMTNSSVTTEANQASGGAIKITTTPSGTVELTNSTISASVLDGAGGGGSVNIDPLYILMQNSQILAQAVQGPGGNITINITNGGLFLPDANSVISASSQFGVNGTVTIQSPNAPASGQVQPLGKSPLLATSLLNQHCAALAGGEFSSFTMAGRDSLPAEPGRWLSSPLAFSVPESGNSTLTGAGSRTSLGELAAETPLLSLRHIVPAGFLTQAFAMDWSAGCQS